MDPLLIAKKDNHLNCPAAANFSRRRAASKGRELMPFYEQLHRGKDNHYAVRCPFAGPPTQASCPLSALFRATPSTTIHIFIAIVSAIKRTRLKEANKQELLSLSTSSALLTLPCNFISGISGNTFVRSIPEQSYLFNDCPS